MFCRGVCICCADCEFTEVIRAIVCRGVYICCADCGRTAQVGKNVSAEALWVLPLPWPGLQPARTNMGECPAEVDYRKL